MPFPDGTSCTIPPHAASRAILARLEAATGPDAALDADIHAALAVTGAGPLPYTASFDAASDLLELALPDWSLDTQSNREPDDWTRRELGPGPHLYASLSRRVSGRIYSPISPPCVGSTKGLSVCIALFTGLVCAAG